MFLVVTVPVILGMIIRKFAENFISSKVEIFNKLNIILFAVFFVAAFYSERENFISFIKQAGLNCFNFKYFNDGHCILHCKSFCFRC